MNIFDHYLDKIIKIIKTEQEEGNLILPEELKGINVDSTPHHFDYDGICPAGAAK